MWRRLLDGEFTEVAVLRCDLAYDLPQTLGLEPIYVEAYQYTSDGRPRTQSEIGHIAEQLAAEKRWIMVAHWAWWAFPFLKTAQVILVFDVFGRAARAPGNSPGALLAAAFRQWRARHRATKSGAVGGVDFALTSIPVRRRDPISDLIELAEAHYPDKILHVTSYEQLRQLRKVRARRDG